MGLLDSIKAMFGGSANTTEQTAAPVQPVADQAPQWTPPQTVDAPVEPAAPPVAGGAMETPAAPAPAEEENKDTTTPGVGQV